MRRTQPDIRKIKRKHSYTVPEISGSLGVAVGTVRRWITAGLPTIDDQRPKLVHGSVLRLWLIERRKKRRVKCGPRQMYCFRCRDARNMLPGSAVVTNRNDKAASIKALCIECGSSMFRQCSKANAAEWINCSHAPTRHQPSLIASSKPLLHDHSVRPGKIHPGGEGVVISLDDPGGNQHHSTNSSLTQFIEKN